jgi:hypothetical protein
MHKDHYYRGCLLRLLHDHVSDLGNDLDCWRTTEFTGRVRKMPPPTSTALLLQHSTIMKFNH